MPVLKDIKDFEKILPSSKVSTVYINKLKINPEFEALIPPISDIERRNLEESIEKV